VYNKKTFKLSLKTSFFKKIGLFINIKIFLKKKLTESDLIIKLTLNLNRCLKYFKRVLKKKVKVKLFTTLVIKLFLKKLVSLILQILIKSFFLSFFKKKNFFF
jgi:hypothetical protein